MSVAGRYEMVSSENFGEYLKAVGKCIFLVTLVDIISINGTNEFQFLLVSRRISFKIETRKVDLFNIGIITKR